MPAMVGWRDASAPIGNTGKGTTDMQSRRWLTGLTIGTLALTGMVTANPLTGSAQQTATPPASQTSTQATNDEANGPAVLGTPIFKPQIDIVKAQELALADQPGAVVTDVSLEGGRGMLEYSVELDNGKELHVNATSGDILPDDSNDEGESGDHGDDENNDGGGHEDGDDEG